MGFMDSLDTMSGEIYRYLNFNEIESFMQGADKAKTIPAVNVEVSA